MNTSTTGIIDFNDKLNQVIKENKLLQKKTKMKSFAEIRAAFNMNKKTPKPRIQRIQKITKSPIKPIEKINKDKNSSEESEESASTIIKNFLKKKNNQVQNQNQNPNINTINNADDKSTDKSGDKSTSDKSVSNNNNVENLFQKANNPEKKENQIDNNVHIENILQKSVTKLEKPKNQEVKITENETEPKIDLTIPDPSIPNQIVLDEEIEEEINDDDEEEVVEELESSGSEVDLSNINDMDNPRNKRPKIDLNLNANNNININNISNMVPMVPIEIPSVTPNPTPIITEATPQPLGVTTIIQNNISTIPNIPTLPNLGTIPTIPNISTIPNITTMPNIGAIPTIPNINSIPTINPMPNIHDMNGISNNINIMNTINAINEPRKYTKRNANKNIVFNTMNGINKYNHFNTINIQKHIMEVNPEQLEKEFYEVMNGPGSTVDRLVNGINFFMDQGFTENVRYVFYENLMNLGLPINGNFNKFYQTFIANCGENQRGIPCKIAAEFYFEFIFKILVDNISEAKQRYISDFFFNGNKYEIIRNNFNLITYVRELIAENQNSLYNFIMNKYDLLFKDIVINNIKINTGFSKYKSIISKMLANVILRCDKHGYLNYKQFIDNERVIFDGLKIKDSHDFGHGKFSVKKMISIKVFGQELTNKKFNDVVKEYFIYLFSHFNYAEVMQYK